MLDITNFQRVTPRRPVNIAENVYQDLPPIDVVVFLNEPEAVTGERGKRYVQNGILRTRRGSDLIPGDEITLPEGVFGVVGGPLMNRNHSMTGTNFGWVRYGIRKGG